MGIEQDRRRAGGRGFAPDHGGPPAGAHDLHVREAGAAQQLRHGLRRAFDLPVIAASLLVSGPVVLDHLPRIGDVETLLQAVRGLGADVVRVADRLDVAAEGLGDSVALAVRDYVT